MIIEFKDLESSFIDSLNESQLKSFDIIIKNIEEEYIKLINKMVILVKENENLKVELLKIKSMEKFDKLKKGDDEK